MLDPWWLYSKYLEKFAFWPCAPSKWECSFKSQWIQLHLPLVLRSESWLSDHVYLCLQHFAMAIWERLATFFLLGLCVGSMLNSVSLHTQSTLHVWLASSLCCLLHNCCMQLRTERTVPDARIWLPFLLLLMVLTEAVILQQALGQARCRHPPRCGYCEKNNALLLEANWQIWAWRHSVAPKLPIMDVMCAHYLVCSLYLNGLVIWMSPVELLCTNCHGSESTNRS